MKLSAWHKSKGDNVGFDIDNPDKVYISGVFGFNKQEYQYDCPLEYGGSCYDIYKKLPYEIEHICPDYELYNIDYSMGFTSRGCIRNCKFCIVPKKEGRIINNAPLIEFLRHNKLILLDNSFLQSPKWKENLQYIIDNKIQVNISQGVDVRLITDEQCLMLNKTKLKSHTFKGYSLPIAWDYINDEIKVRCGIEKLISNGVKPYKLNCYVLVGFNSSYKDDLYRINTLWNEYKILPFVMKYNKRKDDKILNHMARWCNNRWLFKSCTFEEYLDGKEVDINAL